MRICSSETGRFEGFCVDLLEHLADLVGFNYNIEIVHDNNYGALDHETGEWNGLVRGNVHTVQHPKSLIIIPNAQQTK